MCDGQAHTPYVDDCCLAKLVSVFMGGKHAKGALENKLFNKHVYADPDGSSCIA